MRKLTALSTLVFIALAFTNSAIAADAKKPVSKPAAAQPAATQPAVGATGTDTGAAERINVEAIREKYWARGSETELAVVQNRLYSKANKLEFGGFLGFVSSDPFLNLKSYTASAAYHFSEYWALNLFYMKYLVSYSSAYETFMEKFPGQPRLNTNNPNYTLAGEVAYSPIYGKLSLVGKKIIYYDMHVMLGAGITDTENGRYPTVFPGIGQQIYLTKWMSFRIDYRPMVYNEEIIDHMSPEGTASHEASKGFRLNWNHSINLGITILLDLNKEKAPNAP